MKRFQNWKERIGPFDRLTMEDAKAKWDAVAKPLDGLGVFETQIARIAGMQRDIRVELEPAALFVFCADNGVIEEGVSQSNSDVTAAVAQSLSEGTSSVCRMAEAAETAVIPVDVGMRSDAQSLSLVKRKIRRGTNNFVKGPAMSDAEAFCAIDIGFHMAKEAADNGVRLLLGGEMGIGNTTTSAALTAALLALPADEVCGRGAGLNDIGLARKKETVRKALSLYELGETPITDPETAFFALSHMGGFDIAALCGFYIGAACEHCPVILDGVISLAAACLAERLVPGVKDYMVASHLGKEPAAARLLEELSLRAPIHGDLALGEGTGAVMMVPLLRQALAVYRSETVFAGLGMEPYRRYES